MKGLTPEERHTLSLLAEPGDTTEWIKDDGTHESLVERGLVAERIEPDPLGDEEYEVAFWSITDMGRLILSAVRSES